MDHTNTLEKVFIFFSDLTQITELREHKMCNVPLPKDIDDKWDNEFYQFREDLGFLIAQENLKVS